MDFLNVSIFSLTLLSIIIFVWSYLHDPRKIINGFLFTLSLFFIFISLFYVAFKYDIGILKVVIGILVIIYIFLFVFGTLIITTAAIWNARIIFKKEGFKKSNALTLILGLIVIILFIISLINFDRLLFPGINEFISFIVFIFIYFMFIFINYLLASFLYHFYRPKYDKDFIIILGSGLINGHIVSPLLQSRINRAIDFYNIQLTKTNKKATLVFSGGQGPDEDLSEAEAMQKYALSQGIPIEQTLIENKSTTTYENMLFSKKLINQQDIKHPNIIFATNNYHVFRASIYAKKAGLDAQGIGGKTALYYWPNATIREFMAIIVMYKKWHIIFISLSTIIYLSSLILPKIFN